MTTIKIPSWHADTTADDPEMVEIDESEILTVLAWRLHDLRREIAELRSTALVP